MSIFLHGSENFIVNGNKTSGNKDISTDMDVENTTECMMK